MFREEVGRAKAGASSSIRVRPGVRRIRRLAATIGEPTYLLGIDASGGVNDCFGIPSATSPREDDGHVPSSPK